MEQLIMNNADRVRCDVNGNSNNGNAGVNSKDDANDHGKASYTGSVSINKLLALAALLLFALIAAPAQAIVVTYTHTDAQGSVVAISDQDRNVTRFGYEPYGLPTQPPPPDSPGYTGHVHDSNSGLIYMQQRYYDPEIGQFISTDPVGVSASTGANFNRYAYANNNPYTFVDPDGRLGCPRQLGNRCKGASLKGMTAQDGGGGEVVSRSSGSKPSLDAWLAASPEEREQMVHEAVNQVEVNVDTSVLLAECGACMRFEHKQQQYLNGRIGRDDLMDFYFRQGIGGAIGIGLLTVGAGARYLWTNTSFDGPSAGVWYAQGRIFGIRWRKSHYGVRLDLHSLAPGGPPVLHINYGSMRDGENNHVKIWTFGGK